MNKLDALSIFDETISCLQGASEQVEALSERTKAQNYKSIKYYQKIIRQAYEAHELLRNL